MFLIPLACVPSELGGSQMGQLDERCGGNYASSVDIPNGVVCYNGSSTGAEAVYFCNDGYRLEGERRRVCQSDGLWNGSVATCDLIISTPTTSMNCVFILFSLTSKHLFYSLSFIAGVIQPCSQAFPVFLLFALTVIHGSSGVE